MRSETKSSVVRDSKPITWGFACRPDIRCYKQRDITSSPEVVAVTTFIIPKVGE
jgi:hypothetical protein